MATHNEYKLIRRILARSQAKEWDQAKQEWTVDRIYRVEPATPGTCLCGHHPIIEHCVLRNKRNNKRATVGNVCVKKFIGIDCTNLFASIERVSRDYSRALSPETIDYAYRHQLISPWETKFYLDTCRKRKLSVRQSTKRQEINRMLIEQFKVRHEYT